MFETTLNLLNKISDAGYEAYAVGGYPRDLYMKRNSADVDICTNATPKDIKQIFENVDLESECYGAVKLTYHKVFFEITTFRKDIIYSRRKPIKIMYVNSLNEDLLRRDFTINTLCINKEGKMIDIMGAKKDIDKKIIKMIDNPKKRLEDDPLRILRAIRFATILDFELDDDLKTAIIEKKDLIKTLSYERKKQELDLIFSSINNEKGILLLKEISDALELDFENIRVVPSSLGIWAQLNTNIYPFTSNEKDIIQKVNNALKEDVLEKHILYKYGLYICTLVGEIKNIDRKLISKKFDELSITNKDEIALEPTDICKLLNKEPGKFLGDIINDLEEKIITGKINNNKEEIIEYIKNTY